MISRKEVLTDYATIMARVFPGLVVNIESDGYNKFSTEEILETIKELENGE